ncbi:hypothetical protein C7B64_20450 [Merismopedia glauca CCAP 1448/3]|uniref:Uncharacterized protein n=2 Tax=Merismopedia TaxID=53402 RepID=A0A2T1BYD9_9CYAN|nr:hypothetical protein C7B64_20450 [Merismopedia glauca CCAP 1448/3]
MILAAIATASIGLPICPAAEASPNFRSLFRFVTNNSGKIIRVANTGRKIYQRYQVVQQVYEYVYGAPTLLVTFQDTNSGQFYRVCVNQNNGQSYYC